MYFVMENYDLCHKYIQREMDGMNKGDVIIYACVIIGAGIGLALGSAFPGVLVGLGVGYLIKMSMNNEEK
jgi:hypothetical protein